MQCCQAAIGGDFEDRPTAAATGTAGPTGGGCPVEVPIHALDEACEARVGAIGEIEAVQRGQRAPRIDSEDRATAGVAVVATPASDGCPIDVPVAILDHYTFRYAAVCPGEVVQRSKCATRGNLEDCPIVKVGPARLR